MPLTLRRRFVLLALALACALGGSRAGAAEAQGSALDARGLEASRDVDERGLSLLRPERRRSPSGLLYPYPFKPPPWSSYGGLAYRGFVESGYIGDTDRDDETRYGEHAEWKDGLLVRDFFLDLRGGETADYAHFEGGAAGRDDAFYRSEFGRRGWLRLNLYYDEVPHAQANDALSVFQGIGTERLALPPPLTPGCCQPGAIAPSFTGLGERELAIERDRTGGTLAWRPAERLSVSGHYRRERRQGDRPFGGGIFFSFFTPANGSVIETVEPIDSLTHDFGTGLQYGGQRVQANLRYLGSAFDNDRRELRWENPFLLPGLAVPEGRSALAPDNLSHAFKGDLAVALPWSARWTASAGWNGMTQDERLLPGTINAAAFPDWSQDDLSSLSRRHADARVQTWFVDSSLRLRPLRPLTTRLHMRYFQRDDRTDYVAFNPVALDHGYVAEDGRFGVIPRYAPVPFDHSRLIGEASALWRTPFRANLELEYAHENFDREQRARDTREDRGRVSLVSRRLGPATLRLAYELRDRRGSDYDPTHDGIFYSDGPPTFALPPVGTPVSSLREFRQRDLSSRFQHEGQARLHLALGSAVDLSLTGRARNADHDSDYGLDFERARDLNLELGWQPSPRLELHAFGSVEKRVSRLGTIDSDPACAAGTPAFEAGGSCFPLANRWSSDSDGVTGAAGAGFRASLTRRLEVSGDYTWMRSRDELDYDFASDAALTPGTTGAVAGTGLPTLRMTDQVLRLGAELEVTERWSARIFYRLEHSSLFDPQQRGLQPVIRRTLNLTHVDRSFTAHVFGAAAALQF